jgi:GT2 family glycosyltransferase
MNAAAAGCDIVIPVFNKPDLTRSCLESIFGNTDSPYKVILVDNGSDADTKRMLTGLQSSREGVSVIGNPSNLGWVKAVNQGIRISQAPYVCIMNNDTVVETGGWLRKLIEVAESAADIGLVNPDFGERGRGRAPKRCAAAPYIEVDFCRGYCVLIKRSVIGKIGVLDEAYGLGYYDDDDYSVRAVRAGFRCVRAGHVTVRHLRDSTFRALFADEKRLELHRKNRELFYAKWGKRLKLAFAVSEDADRKRASDILLGLARRQHILYVWNAGAPLGIRHINISERRLPRIVAGLFMPVWLRLNGMKSRSKRLSAVFTDDDGMRKALARAAADGVGVYGFDPANGAGRVMATVDSLARV